MSDLILKVEKKVPRVVTINRGIAGPPIIASGSEADPLLVSSTILVPKIQRCRAYLSSDGADQSPALTDGLLPEQELLIHCIGQYKLTLIDSSNIKLWGGEWIGSDSDQGQSVICLLWSATSEKWTELFRNEI